METETEEDDWHEPGCDCESCRIWWLERRIEEWEHDERESSP
jgi:hypothetical protein